MLEILEHLPHIGKDEETAAHGTRLVVQVSFKIFRLMLTLKTQNLTNMRKVSPLNIETIGKDEQTARDLSEAVKNF